MAAVKHADMDELDLELAALLHKDARMPAVDLARALGVSRQTVTKRLDRLLRDGVLHLLAETDYAASGKDYVLVLGLSCEQRPVDEVARQVAELEEALVVVSVTGRFDIELVAAVETLEQVNYLLTEQIPAIPGISSASPSLCLDVVKFESNKVPFTA